MSSLWTPPRYRRGIAISLDLSLEATGYGIINYADGIVLDKPHGGHRAYGTITPPNHIHDTRKRRNYTVRFIHNLAKAFKPEIFIYEAIEGVIYSKGRSRESNYTWTTNGIKLVGAVEAIADQRRRPIYSITPMEWKNHFALPMGKRAEGRDPKMEAIQIAQREFDVIRLAEDPAEALLQGKAFIERKRIGYSNGQLRFV